MKQQIANHFVSILAESFLLALFLCSVPYAASQDSSCRPASEPGQWSAVAIDVSWPRQPQAHRNFCASSPDHLKVIHVVDDYWWVETNQARITPKWDALMQFELQWAPDSQTFYTTQSEGLTIIYTVDAYHIVGNRVERYRSINHTTISDFNRRHRCWNEAYQTGNAPNIAGLTWIDNSKQLLVVAQVPPIGICGDGMRYFGGYLITLPSGRITRRFSPNELKTLWGQKLGPHLQDDLARLPEDKRNLSP